MGYRAHERENDSVEKFGSVEAESGLLQKKKNGRIRVGTESERAEGKYECEVNRNHGHGVPRGREPFWCLVRFRSTQEPNRHEAGKMRNFGSVEIEKVCFGTLNCDGVTAIRISEHHLPRLECCAKLRGVFGQ